MQSSFYFCFDQQLSSTERLEKYVVNCQGWIFNLWSTVFLIRKWLGMLLSHLSERLTAFLFHVFFLCGRTNLKYFASDLCVTKQKECVFLCVCVHLQGNITFHFSLLYLQLLCFLYIHFTSFTSSQPSVPDQGVENICHASSTFLFLTILCHLLLCQPLTPWHHLSVKRHGSKVSLSQPLLFLILIIVFFF